MRQARIQKYSIVLMALIACYTIYYPYSSLSWLVDFSFLQPERMEKNNWTGGLVDTQIRVTYFLMWLVPVLAGIYACLAGMFVADLCRKGLYFSEKVAKGIIHLGISIMVSLLSDTLATSFTPKVLSWLNPVEKAGLRFRFDYADTGLILCGFAFCIMGLVMREAVLIAKENDGFV